MKSHRVAARISIYKWPLMIMSMGWDYVSELRPSRAYCSFPMWYISMEDHGGMISTGETPDSSTRSLWQCYEQTPSSKSRGTWQTMNLAFENLCFTLRSDFLTCCNILRDEADGFTFPPKVSCRFLSLDLNRRTLGPMASILLHHRGDY
jgi:hypothetical protein